MPQNRTRRSLKKALLSPWTVPRLSGRRRFVSRWLRLFIAAPLRGQKEKVANGEAGRRLRMSPPDEVGAEASQVEAAQLLPSVGSSLGLAGLGIGGPVAMPRPPR
jgi:hypothetical protein